MLQIHPEFESLNLLLIVGATTEAKEIIDLVREGIPEWNPAMIVDPDPRSHGTSILEVPVVGGYEKLEHLRLSEVKHAILALGRRTVSQAEEAIQRLQAEEIELVTLLHPGAMIGSDVEVAPGGSVMAGAILGPGVKVGVGSHIGAGVVIGPDARIGDACFVGAGSRIAAGIRLPHRSWLELGACLLPSEDGTAGRLSGGGEIAPEP